MRRLAPLALAALLLSACVAITVERRRPRKGPVKEVGYVDFGGGHVRYSAEGWAWIVASRRKTALKLMSVNCGKELKPEIVDEYTRADADAAYNGLDIDASVRIGDDHYQIERYVHLSYECRQPGAPAASVSTTTVSAPLQVVPQVYESSMTVVLVSSAPASVAISSAPVAISSSPVSVAVSSAAAPAASVSTTTVPASEPPK